MRVIKDAKFIGCAIASLAEFLITGDGEFEEFIIDLKPRTETRFLVCNLVIIA